MTAYRRYDVEIRMNAHRSTRMNARDRHYGNAVRTIMWNRNKINSR